jgi:hypothetical protein
LLNAIVQIANKMGLQRRGDLKAYKLSFIKDVFLTLATQ